MIFHVATAADWAAAQVSGRYTTSTRGRTLAEEGFVHAARGDQWQGVRERYYADVDEPLVLLTIDTDRLGAPVVEESAGGTETFPHVYGAIEAAAVVRAIPLDAATTSPTGPAVPEQPVAHRSFTSLFLEEMSVRMGLGIAVLVVAVLGGLLVISFAGDIAGLVTIAVLLVAGLLASAAVVRRRERRLGRTADSGA